MGRFLELEVWGCFVQRNGILLTESSISPSRNPDMTRINNNLGGVNMAQGFPDFPPPPALVEAAEEALRGTFTSTANTWGAGPLREAIAEKFGWYNGLHLSRTPTSLSPAAVRRR